MVAPYSIPLLLLVATVPPNDIDSVIKNELVSAKYLESANADIVVVLLTPNKPFTTKLFSILTSFSLLIFLLAAAGIITTGFPAVNAHIFPKASITMSGFSVINASISESDI